MRGLACLIFASLPLPPSSSHVSLVSLSLSRPQRGKIPEIKSYTCGPDAGLDPARNHDYALVGDFENAEAYEVCVLHRI